MSIPIAIITKFIDIARIAQERAKNYFPSHGNQEPVRLTHHFILITYL